MQLKGQSIEEEKTVKMLVEKPGKQDYIAEVLQTPTCPSQRDRELCPFLSTLYANVNISPVRKHQANLNRRDILRPQPALLKTVKVMRNKENHREHYRAESWWDIMASTLIHSGRDCGTEKQHCNGKLESQMRSGFS